MKLQQAVSLQPFNTLAVPARARYLVAVDSLGALQEAVDYSRQQGLERMVLGGGSNIVLASDFPGLVIQLNLRGSEILEERADAVTVQVAAGENWDDFVRFSLDQGWYGLENLSAIPGNVGAAPIQNIGAYGVELSSVLKAVVGYDIEAGTMRRLEREACELAYRDSIFKHALKDRFVITAVELRLSKIAQPETSYPALMAELADETPTPEAVAQAVRRVRARKLPAPDTLPNAGSFFKNPIVDQACYERLRNAHPAMPAWPVASGVKLAAGWLLEQAGWKGYRGEGDLSGLGTYHEQALVLINPGRVAGQQVLALARAITESVSERFGVELDIEPRVYG
ncbi:UDP-N-acetylmuramate dehydrogenase [Litorivivens sp.]|uniref:UDP-N-acetylmuramate dehydrogenase n=1 Tax=Litorivivens sp. TaxID=2020868 RepID=UPI0035627297